MRPADPVRIGVQVSLEHGPAHVVAPFVVRLGREPVQQLEDHPVIPHRQGWVDRPHRHLRQHLSQRLGHLADTDGTHHPPGPAFLSDSVAVGQHRQIGAVIGELQGELRS